MRTFANTLAGTREILLDLMIRHRDVVRTDTGTLRFVCEYNRDHSDGYSRCHNNDNGICSTEHDEDDFPWVHVTKYNGRKMYKCPCG